MLLGRIKIQLGFVCFFSCSISRHLSLRYQAQAWSWFMNSLIGLPLITVLNPDQWPLHWFSHLPFWLAGFRFPFQRLSGFRFQSRSSPTFHRDDQNHQTMTRNGRDERKTEALRNGGATLHCRLKFKSLISVNGKVKWSLTRTFYWLIGVAWIRRRFT